MRDALPAHIEPTRIDEFEEAAALLTGFALDACRHGEARGEETAQTTVRMCHGRARSSMAPDH